MKRIRIWLKSGLKLEYRGSYPNVGQIIAPSSGHKMAANSKLNVDSAVCTSMEAVTSKKEPFRLCGV